VNAIIDANKIDIASLLDSSIIRADIAAQVEVSKMQEATEADNLNIAAVKDQIQRIENQQLNAEAESLSAKDIGQIIQDRPEVSATMEIGVIERDASALIQQVIYEARNEEVLNPAQDIIERHGLDSVSEQNEIENHYRELVYQQESEIDFKERQTEVLLEDKERTRSEEVATLIEIQQLKASDEVGLLANEDRLGEEVLSSDVTQNSHVIPTNENLEIVAIDADLATPPHDDRLAASEDMSSQSKTISENINSQDRDYSTKNNDDRDSDFDLPHDNSSNNLDRRDKNSPDEGSGSSGRNLSPERDDTEELRSSKYTSDYGDNNYSDSSSSFDREEQKDFGNDFDDFSELKDRDHAGARDLDSKSQNDYDRNVTNNARLFDLNDEARVVVDANLNDLLNSSEVNFTQGTSLVKIIADEYQSSMGDMPITLAEKVGVLTEGIDIDSFERLLNVKQDLSDIGGVDEHVIIADELSSHEVLRIFMLAQTIKKSRTRLDELTEEELYILKNMTDKLGEQNIEQLSNQQIDDLLDMAKEKLSKKTKVKTTLESAMQQNPNTLSH
jgi:hypothetical protein